MYCMIYSKPFTTNINKFTVGHIELYPFQHKIIKIIKEQTDINSSKWNDYHINYVYHPKLTCEKTTLISTLLCNYQKYNINVIDIDLSLFNDYKLLNKELYQQVSKIGKRDNYAVFLDFPKAIIKERLFQLYSAIERTKYGLYCDEKNKFYINCPSVWIFSNNLHDIDCMNTDKLIVYTLSDEKDLIELDECKLNLLHFKKSLNDK